MAFFKFRQRGQPAADGRGRANESPPAAGPQETIDTVRRRARQRLIGAAVLVLVAVVGFPLLFDTQPRPVTVDAAITIPDKDKVKPLRVPEAASAGARLPDAAGLGDKEEVLAPATTSPRAATGAIAPATPKPAEPKPAEPKPAESKPASPPPERGAAKPAEPAQDSRTEEAARAKREADERAKREEEARAKREQEARAKRETDERARREEAARARALLEGRAAPAPAPAAADSGRFIIQIGAFAEADTVRDVRQQAERAGVRTYTQVVDTKSGKRTRVRVGPFASRADAEKAAAALKRAGLGGSILAL